MTDRRKLRGRRRQRGATLLPYPFDSLLPRCCCLSFFPSVRVSQQRVSKYNFSNLSPFSPCRGRETRFTLERKRGHTFIHVFFLRKKLVHFVDCQPERNLNIFSFIILLQRERRGRGCDECWKHRAFSLYRGICNLMEFAGNINKPSKRFPNWKNKRVNSCEQIKIGRYEYSKINERRILLIFFD